MLPLLKLHSRMSQEGIILSYDIITSKQREDTVGTTLVEEFVYNNHLLLYVPGKGLTTIFVWKFIWDKVGWNIGTQIRNCISKKEGWDKILQTCGPVSDGRVPAKFANFFFQVRTMKRSAKFAIFKTENSSRLFNLSRRHTTLTIHRQSETTAVRINIEHPLRKLKKCSQA